MSFHLIHIVDRDFLFESNMSNEDLEQFNTQEILNTVWKEQAENNNGNWTVFTIREAAIQKLISMGFKQVPYIMHHTT